MITKKKPLGLVLRYFDTVKIYMTHEIKLKPIFKFVDLQKQKGISNNTINKRIGLLKQCLNFGVANNFISNNPIKAFSMLRIRKCETIIIPRYVILDILYYLDHLKPTKINLRNKVILYLFLDTGMRLSELVNLKTYNLDLDNNAINLSYTKTSVDRTVICV